MQTQQAEVSAQAGYEAARDRALKTTDALILAEARIVSLVAERDALVRQLDDVQRRLETYEVVPAEEEGCGCDATD
jgi:hypothetical protein